MPAATIFLHPESYSHISIGSLTHLFQILCALPPVVCWFTYQLLKDADSPTHRFLLGSTLLTGGFLLNEIYRIHIHLGTVGIDKPVVIAVYAGIAMFYLISFRKQIQATPYPILLIGLGILLVGIVIDSLRLSDQNLTNFLEGVPKLLSATTVSFYFWIVCQQILRRAALEPGG
ncbi:MAG: hypothetical protein ACKO7W_10860 [Elainella sp.]